MVHDFESQDRKKMSSKHRVFQNANRIVLASTDVCFPFVLKRSQFPTIPEYIMTINKSQGQIFDCVGIQLDESVFSLVQLYIALSRCRNANYIKLFMKKTKDQGKLLNDYRYFTKNTVYKEVF